MPDFNQSAEPVSSPMFERILVGGGGLVGFSTPFLLELAGVTEQGWGNVVALSFLLGVPSGAGVPALTYIVGRKAVSGARKMALRAFRFG